MRLLIASLCLAFLVTCSSGEEVAVNKEPTQEAAMDHSKIVTGNGEHNYIILEGATREGNTFTFKEAVIDKPGFLVLHPFKDGHPVQTEYVGAVPVKTGSNIDVDVPLSVDIASGDMFIVMLHYDMNEDEIFDFNDGVTVPDAPVFEGNTLVALRYEAL